MLIAEKRALFCIYWLDFYLKAKHMPPTNVINILCAGVAELVDAPDLGSGIERCEGSSPFTRTTYHQKTPFERSEDCSVFSDALSTKSYP